MAPGVKVAQCWVRYYWVLPQAPILVMTVGGLSVSTVSAAEYSALEVCNESVGGLGVDCRVDSRP